jgi:predicted choloylglycine hydrolase
VSKRHQYKASGKKTRKGQHRKARRGGKQYLGKFLKTKKVVVNPKKIVKSKLKIKIKKIKSPEEIALFNESRNKLSKEFKEITNLYNDGD